MYKSTKKFGPFSCAFRQPLADSHCKWVHGYGLVFQVDFAATTLDKNGWVMDFGGLKALKVIYDDMFDHKLIIARHDPLMVLFKQLHGAGGCDLVIRDSVGIESFARQAAVAAEAELLLQQQHKRVRVSRVECWEHPVNSAVFTPA